MNNGTGEAYAFPSKLVGMEQFGKKWIVLALEITLLPFIIFN